MSQRYTNADVARRFELFGDEAKRNGIDTTGWLLERPDGVYWRVMRRDADGRRESLGFLPNMGVIGRTAAEACQTLENVQGGMYAVRTMRQG